MNQTDSSRKTTLIIVLAVVAVLALICCCLAVAVGSYVLHDPEIEATPADPTPDPAVFLAPETPEAGEAALVSELERRLASMVTTNTDYWQLYGLLENEAGEPAMRGPVQDPPQLEEGDRHTFWMGDEEEQRYWQTEAELVIKADHAYFYVTENASVQEERLHEAAELFDSQIYPTNRRFFGSEWNPGIDNDPRITILVTDEMPPGTAGYFSTGDEYPTVMKPRSNQREMINVTADYLQDLDLFGLLLSHEFQHMIHWNQDQSEAGWIGEGLSLIAEEVNGYKNVLGIWQFFEDPDIQLTNWAEESDDRYRNYAASKLFLSYLSEHTGGYEILADLAADDAYGIDGIDRLLTAGNYGISFVDLFADWVVANLLDDPDLADGRYGYSLHDGSEPALAGSASAESPYSGWVSQFGADYVEIESGASQILFEGSSLVGVTAAESHSGRFAYWSNRRNMLDSSLTRPLDLTALEGATLRFWTWYDIEEHFDYGYVTVSTDDGRTWETLLGKHTSSEDPNEANYGHGYTGKSDGWLREEIDLSAYAGQTVLLRFWYISDPGLNQPGWLVDDISVPELDFMDDAEVESGGWAQDGFVRSSNQLRQTYQVQLVEYGPEISVTSLELDETNRSQLELNPETKRAILVVSGTTRWTSELAPYRVSIK
jgi:hypothetical protein